ncbi:MAG: MmgE/PrpD family protein [Planctomycetota bacterium]
MTRSLAELALNTKADDIPDRACDAGKKMILDTIGVTIAGYNSGGVREVVDQMRDWGGKPEATLLIYGGKFPSPNAAFANSAMAHALDFDQVHKPSSLHIMVSVLPVALAAGEMARASGKDVLAALILGVEAAARLGVAFAKQKPKAAYNTGGFLPSSVVGGFGITAAACRLLGMNLEQTVNAMGISYAQASGNRQALFDKTLTKRLQPAFAARSALWAAMLARRGVTGPPNAIEGRAGLFSVYRNADPCPIEALTGPRDFYEIERDSVKHYPVCGGTMIDAAVRLGQQRKFVANEIEQLEIYLGGSSQGLTTGPFVIGPNPQANAQFNSAYHAALGVLRGHARAADFTDAQVLADKEVTELAKRVVLRTEMPEASPPATPKAGDAPAPHKWSADASKVEGVKVTLKTGEVFTNFRNTREALGPDTMTLDDVIRKFHELADFSGICPKEKADAIRQGVLGLDAKKHFSDFVKECVLLS